MRPQDALPPPLLLILLLFVRAVMSDSSTAARDPFVVASPLVVAVACRDGVALLAAHTGDAPLLYEDDDEDDDEGDNGRYFRDLPGNFCGPMRLQTVGKKSAMLTVGWRADAARLLDYARRFDAYEKREFGQEAAAPYVLASELSLYMAAFAGATGVSYCDCMISSGISL